MIQSSCLGFDVILETSSRLRLGMTDEPYDSGLTSLFTAGGSYKILRWCCEVQCVSLMYLPWPSGKSGSTVRKDENPSLGRRSKRNISLDNGY
jgi:hypothetical protein